MRGVERQVVVTRQDRRAARAAAPGRCARRKGAARRATATGKVRWARGHMVFTKTCAACDGSGRQRIAALRGVRGHGRHVRTEAVPCRPAGRARRARLRVPRDGPRRPPRRAEPAICTSTCTCSRTRCFAAQGDDLCMVRADRRARSGARRAHRRAVARQGRSKLRMPPGTQAGQRFRAQRARRAARDAAAAATCWSRSSSCCRRSWTSAVEGTDAGVRPARTAKTSERDLQV